MKVLILYFLIFLSYVEKPKKTKIKLIYGGHASRTRSEGALMTVVVMNKHVCAKLTVPNLLRNIVEFIMYRFNVTSGIFGCISVNELVFIAGFERKQSFLPARVGW